MKRKLTVAVDFDATIATYWRWRGPHKIGRPIKGAREALEALRERKVKIVLFTTRASTSTGRRFIKLWLKRHKLDHLVDQITDRKVYWDVLFDDRARHVHANLPGGLGHAVSHWLKEKT